MIAPTEVLRYNQTYYVQLINLKYKYSYFPVKCNQVAKPSEYLCIGKSNIYTIWDIYTNMTITMIIMTTIMIIMSTITSITTIMMRGAAEML